MGAVLWFLRKNYLSSLLEGIVGEGAKREIVQKIGDGSKENVLSLLLRCAESQDIDLKRFAIAGMETMASREAYESLRQIYDRNGEEVQEFVAKSLGRFSSKKNREFLLILINHKNHRIVANAIFSLWNGPFGKDQDVIEKGIALLDHSEIRVSIEAAHLLWQIHDIHLWKKVEEKIDIWMESSDERVLVAVIYLVGQIRNSAWLPNIWKGLESSRYPVWTKSVDVLANFDSPEAWSILTEYLLRAPRAREKRVIQALGKVPLIAWNDMQDVFLHAQERRAVFAMVEVLTKIAVARDIKMINLRVPTREKLIQFALNELKMIYEETYCLAGFEKKYKVSMDLLEAAVVEKRKRLIRFLFDIIALLDRTARLLKARNKIFNPDTFIQSQVVELLDSIGEREVTIPLIYLIENTDLDNVAAFGQKRWQFDQSIKGNYEERLLDSSNNWIRAVMLFTLRSVAMASTRELTRFRDLIQKRTKDDSQLVADCATEFIWSTK